MYDLNKILLILPYNELYDIIDNWIQQTLNISKHQLPEEIINKILSNIEFNKGCDCIFCQNTKYYN